MGRHGGRHMAHRPTSILSRNIGASAPVRPINYSRTASAAPRAANSRLQASGAGAEALLDQRRNAVGGSSARSQTSRILRLSRLARLLARTNSSGET